jgi:hypothetical protein
MPYDTKNTIGAPKPPNTSESKKHTAGAPEKLQETEPRKTDSSPPPPNKDQICHHHHQNRTRSSTARKTAGSTPKDTYPPENCITGAPPPNPSDSHKNWRRKSKPEGQTEAKIENRGTRETVEEQEENHHRQTRRTARKTGAGKQGKGANKGRTKE